MATAQPAARRGGDLRNYILVTGAYWTDTLADGASRMLVLFYFYELGYSPFEVASLFLFYEFFGIVTNLVGGWLAARFGLEGDPVHGPRRPDLALAMLGLRPGRLAGGALRDGRAGAVGDREGPDQDELEERRQAGRAGGPEGRIALYRWVAILTGSKNALKGVGFFLGGLLLTVTGFQTAMLILAAMVATALVTTAILMHGGLGRTDAKAKFRHMFSNNRAVNILAAARIFLFASRDVWFVVGLPVYLRTVLDWSFWQVGRSWRSG